MARFTDWIREKLNPAQERIYTNEGTQVGTDAKLTYTQAFKKLESVNRSVNMLASACASLDYDIKDKLHEGVAIGVRQKSLNTLLNFRPNPYQTAQDFRQALFTDFILEGNAFVHFDGVFMYHLPASDVEILTSAKTFINGYRFNGTVDFKESEVFYFRDLNSDSIYRGSSRLESAQKSISTLGGKRPVILDSGLKPAQVSNQNFKDMDFDLSIKTHSERIMQAIGVPPILMAGGNNANISPNLRLFYLETVMPINRRFISAVERYFGYDVEAITSSVSALQPELKDIAAYHSTLVNAGIITANEAREELRYDKMTGHDEIRIPANIAGSAADPSQGGKPKDNQQ